jgi:hypothetical protein
MTVVFLDVVTSLEASFFGMMGATFGDVWAAGWVDIFGFRRCASAAGLFLAIFLPREA